MKVSPMPSIRQTFIFLGTAVLSGIIAGGLSKLLNLNLAATLVIVQSGMITLTLWLGRRLGWWDKVNTSGISGDSLPKILLHMLIGGAIIACGAIIGVRFGDKMPWILLATGIGFIGLLWGPRQPRVTSFG